MADELVRTAIANWGARFTANGVHASDFDAITSGVEQWDDWCAAWCAGAEQHLELGEAALAGSRQRSAGEHLATAATYFHFGKFLFVHDREQARAAHARAVDALDRALPHLDPPGRKLRVPWQDTELVGVLRAPAGTGPQPTVLLVAGLDSTKEELRLVEAAFLERGMATFSLDGPGQGEVEWAAPIRPDWDRVGEAVVSQLAAQPEVDPERIGVWGVSLGGYYAARLASGAARVRAVVSLSGPWDLGEAWSGLNPLTRRAFEVRSGARDERDAAALAGALTLAGAAARIRVPMLVVAGARDRLFAPAHAHRLVSEASGPTELLLLEDGNHGCANVSYRHRPYAADWMAARLAA